MKRFIFCMAAAAMMVASGCSTPIVQAKPDIDKCFTAEAEIKIGGDVLSGSISRKDEGCWELCVTEPFPLEGLTVTVDEEGTKLSMLGMEANADFSDNASSAVRLITEAFESAADNAEGYAENAFKGTNENGGFVITVDENGVPTGINLSGHGIAVKLSEWVEMEVNAEEGEAVLE